VRLAHGQAPRGMMKVQGLRQNEGGLQVIKHLTPILI
jgi:hypothetical protein